jgi:hypothetical protein
MTHMVSVQNKANRHKKKTRAGRPRHERLTASLRARLVTRNKTKRGMDGVFGEESALHAGRFDREAIVQNEANCRRWPAVGAAHPTKRSMACCAKQSQTQEAWDIWERSNWRTGRFYQKAGCAKQSQPPQEEDKGGTPSPRTPCGVTASVARCGKQSQTWDGWDIWARIGIACATVGRGVDCAKQSQSTDHRDEANCWSERRL